MADPSSTPSSRRYHHGDLRAALVSAAEDLAAERGPGGFTLLDVVRHVGVSPAAPYRHFPDRDALLLEVARQGFVRLRGVFEDALAADGEDKPSLKRVGEGYLAFARTHPGTYAIMFSPSLDRKPIASETREAFSVLTHALAAAPISDDDAKGSDSALLTALEVFAFTHGLAMLEAAGMIGRTPGWPDVNTLLSNGGDRILNR